MSCSPLVILGMWIVVLKVSNMPISCRTSFLLVVPRISNFRPCSINTSNEFVYHLWYFIKKKRSKFLIGELLRRFYAAMLWCLCTWSKEVGHSQRPQRAEGIMGHPLWCPVYASACRWGATQAAGLPGPGSLTKPFYRLTQDSTPCWVLLYAGLIWRKRPSAIQNTLQTQHNTYSCLTYTLTATRQDNTTVAC